MRPKVFLSIVVPALVLLVCLAYLRPGRGSRAVETAVSAPAQAVPLGGTETPSARPDAHIHAVPPPASGTLSPEDLAKATEDQARHQATINKRATELNELAMADDAGSLGQILSELDNPEPQIRNAALQAAVQFGSRDAIPRLREAAARTDDVQERQALESAANYLTLPSLTELMDQRRQAKRH